MTTSSAVDATLARVAARQLRDAGHTPAAWNLEVAAALAATVAGARRADGPPCEFREWDLDRFEPITCPEPATHTVTRTGGGFPHTTRTMCTPHADREATWLIQLGDVDVDLEEIAQ